MYCFSDDEADDEAAPESPPAETRDSAGVTCRYFIMPPQLNWEGTVQCGTGVSNIGVGATSAYEQFAWWCGGLPVPRPPVAGAWLLTTSEEHALQVARWQDSLRAAGWRVLTAHEDIISELGSKDGLLRRATRLGLLQHLPRHHAPGTHVRYPCVLKPSRGWAGQHVHIVRSAAERKRRTREYEEVLGSPCGPLLAQEWVAGATEFSTSLVVYEGRLYEAVTMEYTYDRDDYIWPRCRKAKPPECHAWGVVPGAERLRVLEALLASFSGICNVNYKLRASRAEDEPELKVLEINPRVGADLGHDVPRAEAARLLTTYATLEAIASGREPCCEMTEAGGACTQASGRPKPLLL